MSFRFVSLAIVALGAAATAQTRPAPRGNAGEQEASAATDTLNAQFVLDSLKTRAVLQDKGPEERAVADEFWAAATGFADIVDRADEPDKALYRPLLEAYRTELEQKVVAADTPDMAAVSMIHNALSEQLQAHARLAAFPGEDVKVTIAVRAIRNGEPVNGFYVWIDPACCVRPTSSSLPLPTVTSPATGKLLPGTYEFRLVRDSHVVAGRQQFLDGSSSPVTVDVVVPDGD